MASTYSSRLRLELMASGEQSGSWGTKTNTNLGTLIEEAIAGYTTKALSDANYTLSTANGATDEARQMMLKFTGTLTANRNITVPTASKLYFVENATTGGFSLTFKTASGTGVEVLSGEKTVLYCDGTNVLDAITRRPGYNAIINGDMNIWQRGTSFAALSAGAYSADRFAVGNTSAAVYTVSRSTDVPTVAQAGRGFNYSFDLQVTTADAAVAAGDLVNIYQPIEGFNWLLLAQRTTTYSGWCKAKKTGVYGVFEVNGVTDRSYVAEITINAADTWEYKTVTFTASPSAGAWNYTTGVGLYLGICLMAGSTYQTTANAWQTGNFRSTANQVNAMDNTANYFRTTGWKLEPGSVATMSQPKLFSDELAECQRYFAQSSSDGVTPLASDGPCFVGTSNGNTDVAWGKAQFPVPMRTTPSVTIYDASGVAGSVLWLSNSTNPTGYAAANINSKGFQAISKSGAGITAGYLISAGWRASAEL